VGFRAWPCRTIFHEEFLFFSLLTKFYLFKLNIVFLVKLEKLRYTLFRIGRDFTRKSFYCLGALSDARSED
jgi:hypothetical protein